jgi:hypothetical protein
MQHSHRPAADTVYNLGYWNNASGDPVIGMVVLMTTREPKRLSN